MNIIERIRLIFDWLKGEKLCSVLSFNMFNRLSTISEMTNKNWMKVDYSILFHTNAKLGVGFKTFLVLFERIINRLEEDESIKKSRVDLLSKYILICERGLK